MGGLIWSYHLAADVVHQPDVAEIFEELSNESGDYDIDISDGQVKRLKHRDFGELEFGYELLSAGSSILARQT